MKKLQILTLVMTLLAGTTLVNSAFAGKKTEELQGRQDLQVDKIQEGVDNGDLTKHEAKKLIQGQKKINETAQHALSDDKLSRREFHKIEKLQNKEGSAIEKKIDNDEPQPTRGINP